MPEYNLFFTIMTEKEIQIRAQVLPLIDSLASNLFDDGQAIYGRKLDRILMKLESILNETSDQSKPF